MQTKAFRINTPHISAEKIDEEVMIVNLDRGNYYSLTGVAADVWRMIEEGLPEETMLERICADYRGDPAQMKSSLASFTAELQQEQIVVEDQPAVMQDTGGPEGSANDTQERPEFTEPLLEKYTDMQMLLLIDPIHEVNDEHGWPKMKP